MPRTPVQGISKVRSLWACRTAKSPFDKFTANGKRNHICDNGKALPLLFHSGFHSPCYSAEATSAYRWPSSEPT